MSDGAPDASPSDASAPGGEDPDRAGRLARTARVVGARRYRQARRRLREIRDRAGEPVAPALTAAVPAAQLSDLFEYPRKRLSTAYLLWLCAGLLGGHRFYLDREGSAAVQFFTGGGLVVWWAVDAFLMPSMVAEYNRDQAEREEHGRPPRALDFLEVVEEGDGAADGVVPGWVEGRSWGRGRLAVDVGVVALAGLMLGAVSAETASWRAATAVAAIVLTVSFAPELAALRRLPGAGDLLRWAARVGVFYRYHDPGGPLSRLARPMVGVMIAPFRRRARAETHLYLEVGGAFAIVFFVADLVVFGASALAAGTGWTDLAQPIELLSRWGAAAALTLINVYAFATPIGATLYEHALAGRSHRRVWLLGAAALAGIAVGLAAV